MAKRESKKSITTIAQYVLVALMVGAAFWTGTLYQQVKTLQQASGQALRSASGGAGQAGKAQVAGTGAIGGTTVTPEITQEVNLEGEEWTQLLRNPAATRGDGGAKVTMVEFTDYQCPFCKRAFEATWPELLRKYIDTGKVRYLVHDLPLAFHGNAKAAALAARCGGDQDKYWEMHDRIFETQDEWITGNPDEKFKGYAQELGLSGEFQSCYDSNKYGESIESDLALASKVGATGTPTFFINGRQVVGAQPMSAFESVIEEELKK